MTKVRTADLLEALKADSREIILKTTYLAQEDAHTLLQQPDEGKWSISQVIEHLNSYGRYYLPLIETSLATHKHPARELYTAGWLGDYFTRTMLPKNNGEITNKMQSPKNHRPSRDIDNHVVLEEFLQQEHLLLDLLEKAKTEDPVLTQKNIIIKEHEALLRLSGGDARKLLNIFELLVNAFDKKKIALTNDVVLEHVQQNMALYDKAGEEHYDIISAFIKSMRGSDPNGAVYWLARMIVGGEDPLFIARRMLILASEDIGNANPNALLLAQSCFEAVNKIGMPESQLILSQTCIYLATSPKSNSATTAIGAAIALVNQTGDLPVPLHLRNAPTKLMKSIGYGKNYKYAHSFEGNFAELDFLPEKIKGTKLYDPGDNARELESKEKLKKLWGDRYNY